MNKRLKEILKEYEERKHKIIKGDESMNIVVLAGGTSTEREISIVTGTGVCKALRKKGPPSAPVPGDSIACPLNNNQ